MSRVLLVIALAAAGAAHGAAAQGPIFHKQRVTYTNGPLTLVGYVYHPDGRGPFPTVIWNHGSEHDPARGPQFDSVAAVFVPAGYAVFAPMRRGHSDSQGQWIQDTIHATVNGQGMPAAERLMVRLMGTEQLDDQLAGLAYAKTLPFVDANRMVVAGCSYGGIETLLAAERGAGLKAAFSISPAALSWQGHTVLQNRLIAAVAKIDIPVLLIQPPKDASLEPARVLGEAAKRAGKRSFTAKVYAATMPDSQQVHCFGGAKGMRNWAAEAVGFFDGVLGRTGQRARDGYVLTSDSARLYYRVAGQPGPGVDTIITVHGNRVGNRVIMSSYGDWDLRERLHSLRVPLLVVHGERETIPLDLVEEWVTSMPTGMATLMKVPNAAHFTYAERPDLVWPAVEQFLAANRR